MTLRLAGAEGQARAAALLRQGGLVAFATETVYGLGADATDGASVARIYQAKARPSFNPLICHYPDAEAAFADAVPDARATRVAETFWPGPLTLVLPRRPESRVCSLAAAGLASLGVRVPAPEAARALLRMAGVPVAAPSANRSGRISPTSASAVLVELDGAIDAVLDGGDCPVGVESTVLDLTGAAPVLLRPGGVTREALEALLGPLAAPRPGATPAAPGMLASHYAPVLPVRVEAEGARSDEMLLAFGPAPAGGLGCFQLSATRDLAEAARRLFAGLRELDAEGARLGARAIAAAKVPDTDLGVAINDRLGRAAAPR